MNSEAIQIHLLKLKDGTRLLRMTETASGLSLEKEIDPNRPVLQQKKHLLSLFEAALSRAAALTA